MTTRDGRYTQMRDPRITPDGDFGSAFFRIADSAMGELVGLDKLGTTDLDVLKERNGVFLIGEIKGLGYDFTHPRWKGQLIVLERLSRLKYEECNVVECFVAEATPGFEEVKRFRVCRNGHWGPWCVEDARLYLLQYFTMRAHDMAAFRGRMGRKEPTW